MLYYKNSESGFFFPPPKSEYFFSNIVNQNIFLEKNNPGIGTFDIDTQAATGAFYSCGIRIGLCHV
jgi:hypothetical protein